MSGEDQKAKQREATRRYRDRLKAAGAPTSAPRTPEQKRQNRESIARRRAQAKAEGRRLPGDNWAAENPDRHRENVRSWRSGNPEQSQQIDRVAQAFRRSTPWGRINNSMWPLVHNLQYGISRDGKYGAVLGYGLAGFRRHMEAQFAPGMTWDNWGIVWELDHIVPLSTFHFTSLADPLFREAWGLHNLRPLPKGENRTKGVAPLREDQP